MKMRPGIGVGPSKNYPALTCKNVCTAGYSKGMPNAFNKYFINIQQNTDTVISGTDTNEQNHRLTEFAESRMNSSTVFHIQPISVKQVVEGPNNIPDNKATGLDGIGIKSLKQALNAIAPSLTHMLALQVVLSRPTSRERN